MPNLDTGPRGGRRLALSQPVHTYPCAHTSTILKSISHLDDCKERKEDEKGPAHVQPFKYVVTESKKIVGAISHYFVL